MFGTLTLAGFRGDQAALSALIEAAGPEHFGRGEGVVLTFGEHARSGASEAAAPALERLTERTQAAANELALGIEARSRALLSEGTAADQLYREAVNRLGRCRLAPERARAHLLYGEWLRREGRRVDAREKLPKAHEMLATIGMEAFAERARLELLATGEKGAQRHRRHPRRPHPQEAQIARLARDGLPNPEMGAQLFISARTVCEVEAGLCSVSQVERICRPACGRPSGGGPVGPVDLCVTQFYAASATNGGW